jgi:holo-[acyl-carrier protein] synthase
MIVGVGVDVVDLGRFERAIARTPGLTERLFAVSERMLPVHSLAARFAAKEALMKALGDTTGFSWQDMVVTGDENRKPAFTLTGAIERSAAARGVTSLHLSLSHDAGVAIAFVVLEAE